MFDDDIRRQDDLARENIERKQKLKKRKEETMAVNCAITNTAESVFLGIVQSCCSHKTLY